MTSRKGRRNRSSRIGLGVVGGVAAALLLPAAAFATTAEINGAIVDVAAGSGEANGINVDKTAANYLITDTSAPISAGPGCSFQAGFKRVVCSDAGISRVRVNAGNLDDTVSILYTATTPATINGGGGIDTLNGGPGNDTIDAQQGANTGFGTEVMFGNDGNDTVTGSSTPSISSDLDGGPGNDDLEGGAGSDFMG